MPIKKNYIQKFLLTAYQGTFFTKIVESSTSSEAVHLLSKNPPGFGDMLISNFKLNIPPKR